MHGFFGKIPSHGDFITRNLSRNFLDAWDQWLQSSVAESKAQLGERWLDVYLTSPIWRFAVMPGLCGRRGWAGILMPSVDRVGRYFPLSIATPLADGVTPIQVQACANAWFEAIEGLALRTLDDDHFEANGLQSALEVVTELELAAMPLETLSLTSEAWSWVVLGPAGADVSVGLAHSLVGRAASPYSLWWTPGSNETTAAALAVAGLPEPRCFAELLRATWHESSALCASRDESESSGALHR